MVFRGEGRGKGSVIVNIQNIKGRGGHRKVTVRSI